VRTDPTDNGGLFVGRRPGTAPVKYGRLPQRGSALRVAVDRGLAGILMALMALLTAAIWGPLPVGAMWVSSQVAASNAGLWLVVAFALVVGLVFGALIVMRRLDQAWILIRRAGGVDQRVGILGRLFLTTTIVVVPIFVFWFAILGGMKSTVGGS
jgi:hypothetical protein